MVYLLDTNIVSEFLKRDSQLLTQLRLLLATESVAISAITYYEIRRGLLAKAAPKQLELFDRFCQLVHIVPVTHPEIVNIASEIYADLRSRGCLIQDADILIAATAIAQNWVLISNDSDLSRVQGLRLENWLIREEPRS